jgi:HK97 family phage major capsid protein
VNILKSENRGDNEGKARQEFRILKAIRETVEGRGSLTGLEAEMSQEGMKEARQLGLNVSGNIQMPSWLVTSGRSRNGMERRDMLAETTTAGGYTVQTDVGPLIPILEPRLRVLEMGATLLTGLTGNIDFPRNDADATAAWEGEVDTTAETSPTFDRVQMSPERLAAYTDVSRQWLIQSTIDAENFTRQRLSFAVQKALDAAALNGSGSNDQPYGILNTGSVNDITIGTNGGLLTWALIVQFETEIATDNADMGRLGYLFTPGVAGYLKTVKRDVAGNGFIWEGPNGNGLVNGYRALVTTQLPSNLTKVQPNLHAAIFGNWADLIIGQWGGVDLLINPYTKGKEAQIEVIVNSFWDVAVRHPESFCICNEISLVS